MPMLEMPFVCIPVSRRSIGAVDGSPACVETRLTGVRSPSGAGVPGCAAPAGWSALGGLLVDTAHPARAARSPRHTTAQMTRISLSFHGQGGHGRVPPHWAELMAAHRWEEICSRALAKA